MTISSTEILDRLLEVTEKDIVPLTQVGVCAGNKIFGAGILRKKDLSLVVASTNTESENPLWHGEIHTLKKLYEMPKDQRPLPKDCIFFTTHEPCSLCLSAITWGGYDNFYYLFSYAETRDLFHMPHDLNILKEVFHCDHGEYAKENGYWKSYHLSALIDACNDGAAKQQFLERIDKLKLIYSEMFKTYQNAKKAGGVPLE